ncbi:hypothetical protein FZI91_11755 [Mycobacterium sp. CBMA271]|uniref:maleylpyruvate isomerase N-terminal domain-containing protein n=1 Tax=unclassified Mycobacteroides TaxID=2618759 RepID=UPI0012DFB08D|nr:MULTISPECIES: maleylpyruvate isomerase N-terminal domain-containing protein [unclassified Mycobacteroides]MUM16129.1 hypothetical protein [Mycobacteroides sp. CBMA 326]MUM22369.1 hypothetical protein [Mycobacteroides sp. CBMA 271]
MPDYERQPLLRPGHEAVGAYRLVHERVSALLRGRYDVADVPVAACPAWTVRQTLAHLTGVAQDIVALNMEGGGTASWTQAQLDRLGHNTIDELLDLWAQTLDTVIARVGQDGLQGPAAQLVFDALTHEHDIRGALAEPGVRTEDPVFAVAMEFLMTRYDQMVRQGELPTLRLTTPTTGSVQLGDHNLATDRVVLAVSDFEALRAFGGRRSMRQLMVLPWLGDPTNLLSAFGNDAIRPPQRDLVE